MAELIALSLLVFAALAGLTAVALRAITFATTRCQKVEETNRKLADVLSVGHDADLQIKRIEHEIVGGAAATYMEASRRAATPNGTALRRERLPDDPEPGEIRIPSVERNQTE